MKKIVVAEASPTIKSVADSLLRQNGYDVLCTSDGLQAWEAISKEKPDLVLSGLGLSGISGLELCRQITSDQLTGGIPVILMIGAQDSVKEEDIVSSGARGRLRKPFSPKDLLEVVGKLAARGKDTPIVDEPQMPAIIDSAGFSAQVASSLGATPKPDSYSLEWLDLKESKPTNHIAKVASFDLATDDQGLVINEDQYGLANPLRALEDDESGSSVKDRDDDYEWFVDEMKKEMEGKSAKDAPGHSPGSFHKPAVPLATEKIKFDDIKTSKEHQRPSPPPSGIERREPGFGDIAKSTAPIRQQSPTLNMGTVRLPNIAAKVSDEELALIADRVAMKLAAQIASRIDRMQIIEAIKAVISSR